MNNISNTEDFSIEISRETKKNGKNFLRRLYDWCLSWAESKYGSLALFIMAFAESSFFPLPPDLLQIALSVSKPKRAYFYATISTLGSVLGGVLGWCIGVWFWEFTSPFFFNYLGFSNQTFEWVHARYNENAFLAILTSAFTPIPYKVFTIASGVFSVPLGILIIASLIGRAGRFFLVATAIYFFGPGVTRFIDKYFNLATLVLGLLLIAGFILVKYSAHLF